MKNDSNGARGHFIARNSVAVIFAFIIFGKSGFDQGSALLAASLYAVVGILDNCFFGSLPVKPVRYGFFFGVAVTAAGRFGMATSLVIWGTGEMGEIVASFADSWWLYIVTALFCACCMFVKVLVRK